VRLRQSHARAFIVVYHTVGVTPALYISTCSSFNAASVPRTAATVRTSTSVTSASVRTGLSTASWSTISRPTSTSPVVPSYWPGGAYLDVTALRNISVRYGHGTVADVQVVNSYRYYY